MSWWDHISHSVIFKQIADIQQSPHLSSTLDRHWTIIPEWIKENSKKKIKYIYIYTNQLYLCCIPLACDKYTKWKRSQTVSTIDYENKWTQKNFKVKNVMIWYTSLITKPLNFVLPSSATKWGRSSAERCHVVIWWMVSGERLLCNVKLPYSDFPKETSSF